MIKDVPNNQELPFLAAVFTSLLCILFGANAVAIKISLSGLGPFTTAGLRFSIAAFTICLWAKITRRSFGIKKGQIYQLLILSIFFFIQFVLLYLGYNRTSASRGTLLVNLQPFFILFLAHFFIPGDRITKRKILGLSMGFAGMILFFLEKKGVTTDVQVGDFMILITSFLWACNTIYTKRIIHAFKPFQITLYPFIFSVPFFFLAGFIWDDQMVACVNLEVLISLLYQGLITASFGFVAWNYLLQKYNAVSLHSFIFIMPIAGVLLSGLILGEHITSNLLLALLLIVLGIVVVNIKTRRHTPTFSPRNI
jgi:drug/metabolite transporter (DMT)-like permease